DGGSCPAASRDAPSSSDGASSRASGSASEVWNSSVIALRPTSYVSGFDEQLRSPRDPFLLFHCRLALVEDTDLLQQFAPANVRQEEKGGHQEHCHQHHD